jgi:peptidoglycan hydrolase CwlO-like protein
METKETWEIKINDEEIEDEQVKEEIKNLIRSDAQNFSDRIQEAISELKKSFIEHGYTEEDLTGEVKYIVNAYDNGYKLSIVVSVYPPRHAVHKSRRVLHDAYIYYVHDEYTKARNEQGIAVKERLAPLARIVQLEKENAELKRKIEELEQRIKELESGIVEQGDP